MVAVPAAIPVTRPVMAFTVATPVALLDQIPPLTVDAKAVVPVTQMLCVPLRVPAEAGAATVIVPVAVLVPPVHPLKVTV